MNFRRSAALLVLLPLAALADPRDDFRRGGPRVILYEHANFQGGAIVLRPGESAENLARWDFDNGRRSNDRISSIRVEGGAEVMIYSEANFRGEALRVTDDLRDLERGDRRGPRFNDRISSVRVSFDRAPRPGPGPGRPLPVPPVTIDPEKAIRRAYQDVLEREPDPAGLRHYRSLMIERGWTEVQVRDHLRRSDEYRGPYMTARLNRIYRELLGRDVDARGFDHYRNKIIEHGWSDADIRRDIMGGTEYRNRPRSSAPQPERPRRQDVELVTAPEKQT
ncbi:MAG: hypothetical protein C0518_03725 [Opitutus sp.]|nr:hypothetical protein [Opitutus sp.]